MAQNLVVNGGFESPPAGNYTVYLAGQDLGGWLVGGAGVAHVGTFENPPAYEGLQSVELNYYNPGDISQTIATTPGNYYQFSFAMAGQMNQGQDVKTMEVYWNGLLIDSPIWIRSVQQGQWEVHSYIVQATSETTGLMLRGTIVGDGGPYVDDVQVVNAVPEPATLTLLGGLGLLAARRRRK